MNRVLGRCWVLVFVALSLGCESNEGRCETLCEWIDECSDEPVSCTNSEIEECADDIDDTDADCEDAFDEFTDCLEENDMDCSDIEDSCVGEAAEWIEQCEGEL